MNKLSKFLSFGFCLKPSEINQLKQKRKTNLGYIFGAFALSQAFFIILYQSKKQINKNKEPRFESLEEFQKEINKRYKN